MSLNLYLYGDVLPNLKVVRDVEAAYRRIPSFTSEYAVHVLSVLEQARPVDSNGFIDRFGFYLPWKFLSTGTKAALLLQSQDMLIDCRECGDNAISTILSCATTGNALMRYTECIPDGACDIMYAGVHFTDLSELWLYFKEVVV